jgi:NAD+ synthetase
MTILYDQAMKYKGLVLNTCNLSEDLVGYATKFGDAAGDLAPIAHLTKTEVYQMADDIGIPEHLINRVPSAELRTAQTDEKELGFTYAELDSVIELFRSNKPVPMPMSDMYIWMNSYVGTIPVSPTVYTLIQRKSKSAEHKLVPMPNLVY